MSINIRINSSTIKWWNTTKSENILNNAMHSNIDLSLKYNTKQKKLDIKQYMLYDFIYIGFKNRQKLLYSFTDQTNKIGSNDWEVFSRVLVLFLSLCENYKYVYDNASNSMFMIFKLFGLYPVLQLKSLFKQVN